MRLAITALGLCLAAGPAFAQSSYDNRDQGRSNSYDSGSNSSPSYDSQREDRNSPHNAANAPQRQDSWGDDTSDAGGTRARGASFYMKSGDKEFRVDCGGDDSTTECVAAALNIFREIQKPISATSTSPSSSSVTGTTR